MPRTSHVGKVLVDKFEEPVRAAREVFALVFLQYYNPAGMLRVSFAGHAIGHE